MAVTALTGHVPSEADERSASAAQQKDAFTTATSQYFSLLSSIDVRLRRQVYALEEAGIVPADATSKETKSTLSVPEMLAAAGPRATTISSEGNVEKSSISGSGLGNLDVGWLNSRNDKVGKEMEAELWAEARDLIQTYVKEQKDGADRGNVDVSMDEAAEAPSEMEKAELDDFSFTLVESRSSACS